jgi:hypothetical protein
VELHAHRNPFTFESATCETDKSQGGFDVMDGRDRSKEQQRVARTWELSALDAVSWSELASLRLRACRESQVGSHNFGLGPYLSGLSFTCYAYL